MRTEPRLCFIASFCITFIAYRTPQSRFTTSSTWPKPPSPRTRTTLKSESVGLMFSFALSSRMYAKCSEARKPEKHCFSMAPTVTVVGP